MEDAIKTVRIHNWKWTRLKAVKLLNYHLKLISSKYPEGLGSDQYFVVPGYEHVTRDQPVVKYNPAEGAWVISVEQKFINNNNTL